MSSRTVEVVLEVEADPDEVTAIEEVFSSYGLHADVDPGYVGKALSTPEWCVLVYLGGHLMDGVISCLVDDAIRESLKAALRKIRAIRTKGGRAGQIDVVPVQGVTLIIEDELPDDAWEALARLHFRRDAAKASSN